MSKRESASNIAENSINWHSGHYAAMRLEFIENDDDLIYETEHQLNHEPVRIDLLVIKKNKDIQIANELGAAFRGHNIMEYKSEDDNLSIDTIFKANAYALLYKAYADTVDGIKIDDITVTLTRLGYPREAMKALKAQGYIIEEKNSGIYMITGKAIVPTQIIVISQLNEKLHFWITKLRKSITKEQILQVLKKGKTLNEKKIDLYIAPLISVLADVNRKAMDKIREEEPDMGEYFRELFKDDLEKKWNDGILEGKEKTAIEMLKDQLPLEKIAQYTQLTVAQVTAIGKKAALL